MFKLKTSIIGLAKGSLNIAHYQLIEFSLKRHGISLPTGLRMRNL